MSFPARLLQIELEFDLRSAFRISLGHPIGADDHPLARNDRGEADLTPDGLVGAMHTALTRLLDDVTIDGIEGVTVLDDLFGAAVDHDEDLGTPSRLRIVELSRKGREPIELTEDRVALHRGFGAARDERKFDAQIAVARSPWQVGLHLDLDDREDAANSSAQSVAALTLLLREWGQVNEDPTWLAAPGVGGGAGVGLGQFAVRIGPTSQVDLHNRDHLAHWLRRRTSAGLRRDDTGSLLGDAVSLPDWAELGCRVRPRRPVDARATEPDAEPGHVAIQLQLTASGPVLIGGTDLLPDNPEPSDVVSDVDPARIDSGDARSLRRPKPDRPSDREPWRTGSSLRGAVRAHAERIVRELGGPHGYAACDPTDDDPGSPWLACDRRLSSVEGPRDEAASSAASKAAAQHERLTATAENLSPAKRAAFSRNSDRTVREDVCPVCRVFGSTVAGGRLVVSEAPWAFESERVIDHVAIDRFTSGAADTKKFDAVPLLGASSTAVLSLDRPGAWDIALIVAVLDDLIDGWVPLGSRVTRGYGAMRATRSAIDVRRLDASDDSRDGWTRTGPWERLSIGAGTSVIRNAQDLPAEYVAHLDRGLSRLGQLARAWEERVGQRLDRSEVER